MWLPTSLDSIDRRRLTFIAVSATAVAGYVVYRTLNLHHRTLLRSSSPSRRLHRSNAVRHLRRPSRRSAQPASAVHSSSSSDPDEQTGDENADVAEGGDDSWGHGLDAEHAQAENENAQQQQQQQQQQQSSEDLAHANGHTLYDPPWPEDSAPLPIMARAGHNIVTLLFRVSEDNAKRNGHVHRGARCNSCGTVPIRGLRYHCANCPDFDLCETCETQGVHDKNHIMYKIRIPNRAVGGRQVQPVWYTGSGDPVGDRYTPPSRAMLARLSEETGMDRAELESHWEQWTYMANSEWRDDPDGVRLAMDRQTFERCLLLPRGQGPTGPNLIRDRVFSFYDTNRDGLIGFAEWIRGLVYSQTMSKVRRIFDLYDVDNDGFVSRRDFLRMFRANYVLYQEMFRVVLDGLNDHRINRDDARRLVSGRQPISSHFGVGDGASLNEDPPHLEGKIMMDNGHVEVRYGYDDVVRPSQPDTMGREELLTRMYIPPDYEGYSHIPSEITGYTTVPSTVSPPFGPFSPESAPSDAAFIEGLLAPPTSVDEIPDLLVGNTVAAEINDEHEPEPEPEGPPTGANPSPLNAYISAQHRAARRRNERLARRRIHDRWTRRHFYLDEEEGATAPDGWHPASHDVLTAIDVSNDTSNNTNSNDNGRSTGESSKSIRSRSSSKVRFAEDPDGFDAQSVMSNSSSRRSVPERWGGMDIPLAERDAGKEIVYQVVQEAFNELLDLLFKDSEDSALHAARTKDDRIKYKAYIDAIDMSRINDPRYQGRVDDSALADDGAHEGDDGEPFSVGSPMDPVIDEAIRVLLEHRQASAPAEPGNPQSAALLDILQPQESAERQQQQDQEQEQQPHQQRVDEEEAGQHQLQQQQQQPDTDMPYFDPTMPQFRPNTAPTASPSTLISTITTTATAPEPTKPTTESSRPTTSSTDATISEASAPTASTISVPPGAAFPLPEGLSFNKLMELKSNQIVEDLATARGGWGRLSFPQFEAIWRQCEQNGHKLAYIDTWIDLCVS